MKDEWYDFFWYIISPVLVVWAAMNPPGSTPEYPPEHYHRLQ